MATKTTNRRSFVVQAMSTVAGAWVGVSTGGLMAWLSGCASGRQPETTAPSTVADPAQTVSPVDPAAPEPSPAATLATGPEQAPPPLPEPDAESDAGVEDNDPMGPAIKYGGPPVDTLPPDPVKPKYGGSSPPPLLGAKYGGVVRTKYGGPPSRDGGVF